MDQVERSWARVALPAAIDVWGTYTLASSGPVASVQHSPMSPLPLSGVFSAAYSQ